MRELMVCAALVAGLAACDSGGSAVETRARGAAQAAETVLTSAPIDAVEARADEGATEAKPVVTANRRETADAKVQRLFERNGKDFGARSAEDYLARLTAFTSRPPSGAEQVKRPNGDTLIYQASTNTFAVVARDGTPRTMFKPRDGAAYWAEQKERAPTFGQRRKRAED